MILNNGSKSPEINHVNSNFSYWQYRYLNTVLLRYHFIYQQHMLYYHLIETLLINMNKDAYLYNYGSAKASNIYKAVNFSSEHFIPSLFINILNKWKHLK